MPATGGGRTAHGTTAPAPAMSKRSEKARSVESVQAPRRETLQGSASISAAQRPPQKGRANSTPMAPMAPKERANSGAADDNASLYSQDGEEIANDAFFQRYHFPQPVAPTTEEASESSVDSSSDTEGPLSPTHVASRQPAGGVPSEPSSGVGCYVWLHRN